MEAMKEQKEEKGGGKREGYCLGGQSMVVADFLSQWKREIGRTEDANCVCDGWTPQNAAHLYLCTWVEDGRGRSRESVEE